ncbi:unnamed protein product [Hermetia illucens]|uniref:Proton-coupled folate transporter n=1 Tax=Hermetia illucens TaxID=343691 RepID=A0A7R8V539_HERIL|nr:proton-coupled folate transporter-like [Hermetia illucens]XP_037923065.1 proton-coupled folate transporter-like [Hermetia illucens]CAD7092310.1 unnamed protein product [Hermetia illucens]
MSSSTESLLDYDSSDHGRGISGRSFAFRGLVLEPAVLLLFFSIDLSGVVIQNQIIFQTCTVVYGYNKSDCLLLGTQHPNHNTAQIEKDIQPYVANILMVRSVMDGIIPTFGALFVGSWSDRFGRKPIILTAFIGHSSLHILCAILAFASTLYSINPWYYIAMMVPKAILSAECSLKSGALAFITDVTESSNRMLRLAVYEAFLYVGIVAGFLSSGPMFHATNAYTVFAVSGGIITMALIMIWFGLKESVRVSEIDQYISATGLFNWSQVEDLLEAAFGRRFDRGKLWLIISTLTLTTFIVGGSANVSFLFVREKFDWTVSEYTLYQAVRIAIQIVGNTLILLLLQKLLKLSAASVVLLAYGSCILDAVIIGTSSASWEMYLAAGTGILKGMPAPMCLAILSTFVTSSETGKILSFVSILQSLTPLASAPFYTELYSKTIDINPGIFNLVSAGLYTICFIFMTIIFAMIKRNQFRGTNDFTQE